MLRRTARCTAPLLVFLPLTSLFGGCGERVIAAEKIEAGPEAFAALDGAAPDGAAPDADPTIPETPLCATSECPEGRVTCPNQPFPCAVDLSSDDENCGACGVRCANDEPFAKRFHGISRCVQGSCQLVCEHDYADCNGIADDGCEVSLIRDDVDNCGGCGIRCDDVCVNGNCGCPTGETLCADGKCHDLSKENGNCGACGNVCPRPSVSYPPELNLSFRCRGGQCNVPGCPAPRYLDCNQDVAFLPNGEIVPGSDGCETFGLDVNNCGSCGNKCAPGEECIQGQCLCRCGAVCDTSLNSDPDNCGTCGLSCPGASPSTVLTGLGVDPVHGRRTCDQGLCGFSCSPHWADCDGDPENGCEIHLMTDPLNCGGCGVRCDAVPGQPCVEGRCAMKECEVVQ